MGENFDKSLKDGFDSISLNKMNASASFLKRMDTKFVVSEKKFEEVLISLKKHFYILEIDGKKVFEYDSVYMDTEDYIFQIQHQAKEKTRTKVRTRLYVDSNLSFFEYKQRQKKVTRKFRYQFPEEEHGTMTKGKKRFFEGIHMSFYDTKPYTIIPSLRTHYKRMTLCSKDNSERVTIDFDIEMEDLRKKKKKHKLENVVIIESKTTSKKCKSHEIMEEHGVEKSKHCSKYCLGLYYTGVKKYAGIFKKSITKLDKLGAEK